MLNMIPKCVHAFLMGRQKLVVKYWWIIFLIHDIPLHKDWYCNVHREELKAQVKPCSRVTKRDRTMTSIQNTITSSYTVNLYNLEDDGHYWPYNSLMIWHVWQSAGWTLYTSISQKWRGITFNFPHSRYIFARFLFQSATLLHHLMYSSPHFSVTIFGLSVRSFMIHVLPSSAKTKL